MKTVPLHGKKAAGRVALIDDEDYALVSQYRWNVSQASRPGRDAGPYAAATRILGSRRVSVRMHQLITGYPQTDHRNGDGLDNRRANLRPATVAQNAANQGSRAGTSQYKGVSWARRQRRWKAQIRVDYVLRCLGYFVAEEVAARAYDTAALAAWGDYARLNFKEDA